ncbi:conserved hypothetical protein [Vibrio chagasii]|nr:conserved hypothetical protein [Vibrio chagasii]CAH7243213.1 conserved hypothetical protein [Vibrio chagasii]
MKISINTKAIYFYSYNMPVVGEQILITEQNLSHECNFIPMNELAALNAINKGVPFVTDAGEHVHVLGAAH